MLSNHRCRSHLTKDSSSIQWHPWHACYRSLPLLFPRLTKCVRQWNVVGGDHPCSPWVCGRDAGSCVGTLSETWWVWVAPVPDACAPWRCGCRALGLEHSARLMTCWWMRLTELVQFLFGVSVSSSRICFFFFSVKIMPCRLKFSPVNSALSLSVSVCAECYGHTKRRLRQRSHTCFLREKETLLSLYSVNTTSLLQPLSTFSV